MPFGGDFDVALNMIASVQVVSIHGFVGSGKTALAFALARELIERKGYRHIITNIPSVWADSKTDIPLIDERFVDSVCILDEAGQFIDNHNEAKKWFAAIRKINVVVIAPTVLKLPQIMQTIEIRRISNDQSLGLSRLTYQLSLDTGDKISGDEIITFTWTNPSEIYGVYDTIWFPTDDDGIKDWIYGIIAKVARRQGNVSTVKNFTPVMFDVPIVVEPKENLPEPEPYVAKYIQWKEAGGKLTPNIKYKLANYELYPYFKNDARHRKSKFNIKPYLAIFVLVFLVCGLSSVAGRITTSRRGVGGVGDTEMTVTATLPRVMLRDLAVPTAFQTPVPFSVASMSTLSRYDNLLLTLTKVWSTNVYNATSTYQYVETLSAWALLPTYTLTPTSTEYSHYWINSCCLAIWDGKRWLPVLTPSP